MTMTGTGQAVLRAATDAAERLRSVREPDRRGWGQWNLAELAVHMLHVLDFELGTVRGAPVPPVGDFAALTRYTLGYVDAETCRDPAKIASRIEEVAAEFVALTAGVDPETEYDWLGGARLPLRALHGHVVSELSVHGWDVAKAEGRSPTIRRADAVLAIDDFVVPLVAAFARAGSFGGAGAFVDQTRALGFRGVYDVGLTGGTRRHFVFADGNLTIAEVDPDRRVDCRVRADPASLLLILWGRRSPWPAVVRGRLVAYGRKPWLAARLTSLIHTP